MGEENKQPILDTLRLSDERLTEIIAARDEQSALFTGANHRRGQRHGFRHCEGMVITIFQSDGPAIRYAVAARNLSDSGACFLHGAFLHNDTACVVSIRNKTGHWINAVGAVARCSHVEGTIHEIGVRFVNVIDLRPFIGEEDESASAEHSIALPLMVGRALCVIECYDDRSNLRLQLAELGVTSVMTNTADDALELVAGDVPFDVVIADEQLTGDKLTTQLKARGHTEPVIFVTEEPTKHHDAVLKRPVQKELLAATLLQWLPLSSKSVDTHDGDLLTPAHRLNVHLTLLQSVIRDATADREQLTDLCAHIAVLADEHGSDLMNAAAMALLKTANTHTTAEDFCDQCDRMISLCKTT